MMGLLVRNRVRAHGIAPGNAGEAHRRTILFTALCRPQHDGMLVFRRNGAGCLAVPCRRAMRSGKDRAHHGRPAKIISGAAYAGWILFVSWYTRRAQQWFEKQVAELSNRMGVTVQEVKVQDLGFRWGSFGSDGRVSFHWKAILLPPRIAQYVVVHELAHAYHPDHSANFWIKLEQHLPDWRWRKDWLAENGIQVEGL